MLILFLSLLLYHAAGASLFVAIYHYPIRIVGLHVLVTVGLAGLLFLSMGISFQIASCFGPGMQRLVLVLIPALYGTLFSGFYILNLATNHGWGGHVSLTLLLASIQHIEGLWRAMPGLVLRAGVGLAIIFLASVLVFVRVNPVLQTAFASVLEAHDHVVLPRGFRRVLALAILVVYLAALTGSILHSYQTSSIGFWEGEPATALLLEEMGRFSASPKRATLALREKLLRRQYSEPVLTEWRNIVVIVVDGLRPSNMGVYGYARNTTPFLSDMERRGLLRRVEWASSPCSESVCGIMSIFTSKDHGGLSHAALGLHSILHDQGFNVSFLLSGDHHWHRLDKFYGEDITHYRDGRSDCPYGINDDRCVLHFLDELAIDPATPQLIGIHLMSAHVTGTPLPQFERYSPQTRARFLANPSRHAELVNGYDNGVLQADYFIQQVFDRLEAKGLVERSLIVIAADHGEGLGEHGLYGHTNHIYEEFLRVPLLIYDTEPTVYANLEYGSVLDVAPTILDVLGLPIPDTWQGRPLTRPPTKRLTFHQTVGPRPWHSVLIWEPSGWYHYLIQGEPGTPAAREELYDLRQDRAAKFNLVDEHPQLVESLRAVLLAELW